jgi:hypothetical protein
VIEIVERDFVSQDQCEARREKERATTILCDVKLESKIDKLEAKIDKAFWFSLVQLVSIVIGFVMVLLAFFLNRT